MKIHTLPILARYAYRPEMVPEHGSPLFDCKRDCVIKPRTTVRVGKAILTPKQIVYVLNHPDRHPTVACPDPWVQLPPYLLLRDGNPANILIDNLRASSVSGRWTDANHNPANSKGHVESREGFLVPNHLVAIMSPEDRKRFKVD